MSNDDLSLIIEKVLTEVLKNSKNTDFETKQDQKFDEMTVTPIPKVKNRYVDYETGESYEEKPENMTHLRANILVKKNHPRIIFRGKLDSLEAKLMEIEVLAEEEGYAAVVDDLQDVLNFTRQILGSEVRESPFDINTLIGYTSEELREVSHDVKKYIGIPHPIPDYKMGKFAVGINSLRTLIRETELSAVTAFNVNGVQERMDIIEALNRLSSCIYIIFCRVVSNKYYEKR